MKRDAIKARFREQVGKPIDTESIRKLGRKAKRASIFVGQKTRIDIAAALAHAGFLEPGRIGEIYDALSEGWLNEVIDEPSVSPKTVDQPEEPAGLWDEYWSVAEDAIAGKLDAAGITTRTAYLGGLMGDDYLSATAKAAREYPKVMSMDGSPPPPKITLETLAACPNGSLGREFHDMIVDNKFDLEVLDRDEIGLSDLPQPLNYLNTRILQAHDLWHIVAGYETTALHEIAISAFQMAQFGHPYSAQFLAVMGAVGALSPRIGYGVLMTSITTAWAHGRRTPPLIVIDWEKEWEKSPQAIREEFGIELYKSPYPADLIEKRVAA